MCGIAGIFGGQSHQSVQLMLDRLRHRGPDDLHVVGTRDATLGAVRLSIVDVDNGRQPVLSEDGQIVAAQNGEIYNYPQLKRLLLAAGHSLSTRCDTECLPHLYEEHGDRFVQELDGMFAIAVWDQNAGRGILARDRTGKKPLYYSLREGALYFSSEIKGLLAVPGAERHLHIEALHHFLGCKHVPHPLTIFDGILSLPPGHILIYQGGQVELRRYWSVDFVESSELSKLPEEELVDRLVSLLRDAVQRRLMSDVPIGWFLSGGIDSSLISALAAESSATRIKTFTLTYGPSSTTNGKEDDRRWANWVAQRYQTEHHEEQVDFGDFPSRFRCILEAFDEPFSGAVSTYFLSQLISKHVKVAVSGDGADELFGSYLSHRLANPLARFPEFQQTRDPELVPLFEDNTQLLETLYSPHDWKWRSRLLVFTESEKAELYAPEMSHATKTLNTAHLLRTVFNALRAKQPLNRILDAEFKTFLPDQVLAFTDRLSMAHSLEVRAPFLDTRFVEFAASLPADLRIRKRETKYVLKLAACRFFPKEMVYRAKEGFVMPINTWLLTNLKDYVCDTLSPGQLSIHGLFDAAYIQRLIKRFYDGEKTLANKILSLIAFQEWYSLYRPSISFRQPAIA